MGEVKSRYTLAEAAEYLKRETETLDVSVHDIVTLAAEGKLCVCFHYKGPLGLFKDMQVVKPTHPEITQAIFGRALKTVYFNGILRSLSHPSPDIEITDLRGHTRKAHTLHPVRVAPICVFASDPPVELGEPEGHHWRRVHGSRSSWAGTLLTAVIPEAEWMIEADGLHALATPFQSTGAIGAPYDQPQEETPEQRRDRRLKRLHSLGGNMKTAGTGWHTVPRGTLARLVAEEKAAGHPMSDRSDVRRDLIAATERMRSGTTTTMGGGEHIPSFPI